MNKIKLKDFQRVLKEYEISVDELTASTILNVFCNNTFALMNKEYSPILVAYISRITKVQPLYLNNLVNYYQAYLSY